MGRSHCTRLCQGWLPQVKSGSSSVLIFRCFCEEAHFFRTAPVEATTKSRPSSVNGRTPSSTLVVQYWVRLQIRGPHHCATANWFWQCCGKKKGAVCRNYCRLTAANRNSRSLNPPFITLCTRPRHPGTCPSMPLAMVGTPAWMYRHVVHVHVHSSTTRVRVLVQYLSSMLRTRILGTRVRTIAI